MRRMLLAWLLAAAAEYLFAREQSLGGLIVLSQMSLLRVSLLTFAGTMILQWLRLRAKLERWLMAGIFALYAAIALAGNFTWGFCIACLAVTAGLLVYALFGRRKDKLPKRAKKGKKIWYFPVAIIAVAFFSYVAAWTVCRFLSFVNSTYDFGIFTQMFHNMKESGAPMTTLERSKPLSHFQVHFSPIYYVMLPFYWLFPSPVTLQILQAAVLASAVIPLYKLARLHSLSGLQGLILCAVLLAFPAFSGGASYDLHENCFLTPLILWLFYAVDAQNRKLSVLFAALTLTVKEDAAVYVAVIALWMLLRRKEDRIFATALLCGALAWFFAVTAYLEHFGDGVMSNRYENFMYDGSSSLLTVIKAVILCPMKLLYESFEPEKTDFICQTLLPLAFLPFLTRKFERFLLLIPYFLVNLMSDYPYQHDIFFQYTYGPTAFLLYLTAVNIADFPKKRLRIVPVSIALIFGTCIFNKTVKPVAQRATERYASYSEYYDTVREALELVPDGASVTATAFYTPHLSEREVLYDVLHCTPEQLESTEYVVLQVDAKNEYANYNSHELLHDGYENLVFFLERRGYTLEYELENVLTIYKKAE